MRALLRRLFGRKQTLVVNIYGTPDDPQRWSRQIAWEMRMQQGWAEDE